MVGHVSCRPYAPPVPSRVAVVPSEQGRDLLGPPPAGVTVAVWGPADPAPPGAADAGFWVPQYMSPDALDRQLAGLPALEVVQLLTAGADAFVGRLPEGTTVNHTLGIASIGGATMDNEENYLIKKLFGGGLGMVAIENQARI